MTVAPECGQFLSTPWATCRTGRLLIRLLDHSLANWMPKRFFREKCVIKSLWKFCDGACKRGKWRDNLPCGATISTKNEKCVFLEFQNGSTHVTNFWSRDPRCIVHVFGGALAPIAPAKELALECSTKDARKSKTIVDYRLSTILNSKCSTITPRARYKI